MQPVRLRLLGSSRFPPSSLSKVNNSRSLDTRYRSHLIPRLLLGTVGMVSNHPMLGYQLMPILIRCSLRFSRRTANGIGHQEWQYTFPVYARYWSHKIAALLSIVFVYWTCLALYKRIDGRRGRRRRWNVSPTRWSPMCNYQDYRMASACVKSFATIFI